MNNLNQTGKWIIVGVVIVAAVVLIAVYGGGPSASPAPGAATSTGVTAGTPTTTGSTPAGGTSQTGGTKTTGGTATPKPAAITLITPVANDVWVIATQNSIQWSRAPGVTGQIELLDASTMRLAGVILNQIGARQTSYAWNTRDLLLSRTSPSKVTVMPGRYVVKIIFDGNNLAPIVSPPLTITQ